MWVALVVLAAISAGLAVVPAGVGATPAYVPATATLNPPFHTVGDQILDSANQPVILRGVVFNSGFGYKKHQYGTGPPSHDDIDDLKAWGGNVMRFRLSEDLWNRWASRNPLHPAVRAWPGRPSCEASDPLGDTYLPNYGPALLDAVDYATSRGLLVILELTTTNPDCHYAENTPWDTSANADLTGGVHEPLPGTGALPFWNDLATYFGQIAPNPLVAFELYNEPSVCAWTDNMSDGDTNPSNQPAGYAVGPTGCNRAIFTADDAYNIRVWRDGGRIGVGDYNKAFFFTGVGMQQLYGVVRGAAPENLVLLDANIYAADPHSESSADTVVPVAAENKLVYAHHLYPCGNDPCCQPTTPVDQQLGNDCTPPIPMCSRIQEVLDWTLKWARSGTERPVMFTEIGWPSPMGEPVNPMHDMVNQLAAYGSGFTAFTWDQSGYLHHPGNPKWSLRYSTGPGVDPATNTGQAVKDSFGGTFNHRCDPSPPEPPTLIAADGKNQAIWLTLDAPNNADTDATDYTATVQATSPATTLTYSFKCDAANWWVWQPTTPRPNRRCATRILSGGLANNTNYSVTVTATNLTGTSAGSATLTATPHDQALQAPLTVAQESGDTVYGQTLTSAITARWTPPPDVGWSSVSGYKVKLQERRVGGASTYYTNIPDPHDPLHRDWIITVGAGEGNYVFRDVPVSAGGYRVAVLATNAVGDGAWGYCNCQPVTPR